MLPCHYADKVLNDRDRYFATHAGLAELFNRANDSSGLQAWLGEAIGAGLMGGACMKRDQFKRLIVMIRREREYLTKAFLSCRLSLHESAANFTLAGIDSLKQGSNTFKART